MNEDEMTTDRAEGAEFAGDAKQELEEPNLPDSPRAEQPEPTPEVAALRAELEARTTREGVALDQFRTALLATEPEMDPGLVTGDTFETVHASFGAARASMARVREALRLEMAGQVPLGAASRTRERYRTPLEKIRDGLSRP